LPSKGSRLARSRLQINVKRFFGGLALDPLSEVSLDPFNFMFEQLHGSPSHIPPQIHSADRFIHY
jgi:hypothetical protein